MDLYLQFQRAALITITVLFKTHVKVLNSFFGIPDSGPGDKGKCVWFKGGGDGEVVEVT